MTSEILRKFLCSAPEQSKFLQQLQLRDAHEKLARSPPVHSFAQTTCFSRTPLYHKHENRSAILSLLPHQQGMFVGTGEQVSLSIQFQPDFQVLHEYPLSEWLNTIAITGFVSAAGDGSCFLLNEVLQASLELTGSDCDPVHSVVTDHKFIYTSCRDGLIRKYGLS